MPPSSYPLDTWVRVFETFQQVESARGDFDRDVVTIRIRGRAESLTASLEELDDTLYRFSGNPREVALHFLRINECIVYYQDTLVGFFDILGYSCFLENTEFITCIRSLEPFIQTASTSGTDCMGLKLDHWILSDSIIIVIDTNRSQLNLQSLQIFFHTCSRIMATAMNYGFPLRGAVGGGHFYKDADLMVSTALVDAAKYEKEQEWLGAVITPAAIALIEQARVNAIDGMTIDLSSSFARSIRCGAIPWKANGSGICKPSETYFIKPLMSEPDWASTYLPEFFSDPVKVENSHHLYS